jgi:hypothetical protein
MLPTLTPAQQLMPRLQVGVFVLILYTMYCLLYLESLQPKYSTCILSKILQCMFYVSSFYSLRSHVFLLLLFLFAPNPGYTHDTMPSLYHQLRRRACSNFQREDDDTFSFKCCTTTTTTTTTTTSIALVNRCCNAWQRRRRLCSMVVVVRVDVPSLVEFLVSVSPLFIYSTLEKKLSQKSTERLLKCQVATLAVVK